MNRAAAREQCLGLLGDSRFGRLHRNLSPAALYADVIRREEGVIASQGALVCHTGVHTGRSPNDKFIVCEPACARHVAWGGVNRPLDEANFCALYLDLLRYLNQKELYVLDAWAGTDPAYRLPIRVVTELAWHSLFARNMFITRDGDAVPAQEEAAFTVIDAPGFTADPERHGTRTGVFIVIHFGRKLVLIGGTSYAGEIKKSIFTVLNFLLPFMDVLPMHCSATVGPGGDTALFFGLSGTGKTTLSSDPDRRLIGDDEHGWTSRGVFNFEGGCYAKMIRLSAAAEPLIYAATRRFGTILENVAVDVLSGDVRLDDATHTENTRGSYPISFIENSEPTGRSGHPANIVMLTADAYGVLPPISRLTRDGAMYHFLSGYTARVAGTEKGVTEPVATFSACFGAPFLPLNPIVYARMLGERLSEHGTRVWLVNTGWSGGPAGAGTRIPILYTRAMIAAALGGDFEGAMYQRHPVFNLEMPTSCPAVPPEVLLPWQLWADRARYDLQAHTLAKMFVENFKKFHADVSPEVIDAGPRA